MYGAITEWVNLKDLGEREEVETFLRGFDLALDQDVDYTLVVRDGMSQGASIVATCSKARNVLKCFAVREELRGEGIASILISALIDKLFSEGMYHSFIFTKPSNAHIFLALNFKLIHSNIDVALLENGIYDIYKVLEQMKVKLEEELGDVFFALTNYARFLGVNPENALRFTNEKFIKRFSYVEKKIKESGKKLTDSTLQEMDKFWEESKRNH